MRKSKEETAGSRRRILQEAGRLYREKGFDGVGVAQIMEAAGMTHGGFYRHFSSRESLIAETMAEAFADKLRRLGPGDDASGRDQLRAYVDGYLSPRHVAGVGAGCPLAALGSEAAHVGGEVGEVFNAGIDRFAESIAAALDTPEETRRAAALRLLAKLVGAVVIARAAGPGSALGADLLDAVRNDPEIACLIESG